MSLLLPGESHHWAGGHCLKVQFANGFGLSVIWSAWGDGDDFDGFMEVAVTHNGSLCYSTDITDNVMHVERAEARDIVSRVRALAAA